MNIKRFFVDYMPVLSLLLYVFYDQFPGNGTLPLMLGTFFSFPSLLFYLFCRRQPYQVKCFTLLCFLGCLMLFFIGPLNRRDTFVFVGAVSVAIYSVYHLRILKSISFVAIIYTLYILVNNIFIQQIDVNLLYESSGQSKNYPGFLLVIWTVLYSFLKKVLDNKTSIMFPAFAVIIALYLDGRTSIIVLFLLLLINIYSYNKKYSILFMLVICGASFYYFDYILYLYYSSSFFEEGLETSRYAIWNAYLNNIDIVSIFTGVDVENVYDIAIYSGNPHNSFLFYHMSAGLFGLVGFSYLFFETIKKYFMKKKYLLLSYVILVVLRLFYDSCLFWPTDFIVYFIMIFIFYPSQIVERQKSMDNFVTKI